MKKLLLYLFTTFFIMQSAVADELSDGLLKAKIAQMLMVGFNSQVLTTSNPIYSDIKELGIGGVILYSRNSDKIKTKFIKNIKDYKQLKKLTEDLQKASTIPLFIGIEQEGGFISRLSPSYFVISMYSAKDLGIKNNLELTRKEAEKTAKTLYEVGVNVNFAPCVDLEINNTSKLIALQRRSFSRDPKIVSLHAQEVIKAHNKYGILTTLKHYPGLGSADEKKLYRGFVNITDSYTAEEILPYKELISKDLVKGIMTAHVFDKHVDANNPLSFSEKSIQENLIKKLNYKGLIFTDDIQNYSIMSNYTLQEALKSAILAGNDVIVIGNNLNYQEDIAKNSVEIIFNLVKNGTISEERINKSFNKIMKVKKEFKKIESIN